MRVVLSSIGSRGDVQPLAALAAALSRAGADVLLAAPAEFRDLADEAGVSLRPLGAGFAHLARQQPLPTHGAGNPVAVWHAFARTLQEVVSSSLEDTLAATEGADVVVASGMQFLAASAAERNGARYVYAALSPTAVRSSVYPPTLIANFPPNAVLHRLGWAATEWLANNTLLALLNRARRGIGLSAVSGVLPHVVYGGAHPLLLPFSQHVCPPAADWPKGAGQTGYWVPTISPVFQPPEPVARFLDAGPPPVYVGFGTMPSPEPLRTLHRLLEAARRAGVRLLLGGDWRGLGGEGARADARALIAPGPIPHQWLFPRVAAVVHHGGAGTTAAGLLAGRPTLVIPHLGDQFFWGRRVHELQAGPRPLPFHALSAEALAPLLADLVGNDLYAQRSAQLSGELRAENGLSDAVEAVLG